MATQQQLEVERHKSAELAKSLEEMSKMMTEMRQQLNAVQEGAKQREQSDEAERQRLARLLEQEQVHANQLRADVQRIAALQQNHVQAQPGSGENQVAGAGGGNDVQEAETGRIVNAQIETRRLQSLLPPPGFVAPPHNGDHTRPPGGDMPFAMTADQLPKYSAEDPTQPVKSWLERVAEDALLFNWSQDQIFLAARRALTGTARRWLDGRRGIRSWTELRTELETAFGRQARPSDIHHAMRCRKKRKNETLLAYIQEMEFLGAQGCISDEEVRLYISNGITDDIQMQISLLGAT